MSLSLNLSGEAFGVLLFEGSLRNGSLPGAPLFLGKGRPGESLLSEKGALVLPDVGLESSLRGFTSEGFFPRGFSVNGVSRRVVLADLGLSGFSLEPVRRLLPCLADVFFMSLNSKD